MPMIWSGRKLNKNQNLDEHKSKMMRWISFKYVMNYLHRNKNLSVEEDWNLETICRSSPLWTNKRKTSSRPLPCHLCARACEKGEMCDRMFAGGNISRADGNMGVRTCVMSQRLCRLLYGPQAHLIVCVNSHPPVVRPNMAFGWMHIEWQNANMYIPLH